MMNFLKQLIKRTPGVVNFYHKVIYPKFVFSHRYIRNKKMIEESPNNFIRFIYKRYTGNEINLDNPKSFNEKLQWLKLNYYDNLASKCADKYEVRDYVKQKGLEDLLNELISVYKNPEDIDFTILPNQFVLKASHGSGMNIIVKDKSKIKTKQVIKELKKWVSINYAYMSGEWVYRDIEPKILCEKYISDSNGELNDYKIFCFNGKAHYIQVDVDRFTNHRRNIYTTEWKLLDMSIGYPNDSSLTIVKPKNLSKLLEYAERLAEPFVHARVDFYNLDDDIVFGELTFFHGGGFEKFTPDKYGVLFGDKMDIAKISKNEVWSDKVYLS